MHVEEVSQNMYCILSVIEYIIREVSQNIPIYTYSATLAYNRIYILLYLKTPALECIFRDTWSSSIFIDTSSNMKDLCRCNIKKIRHKYMMNQMIKSY